MCCDVLRCDLCRICSAIDQMLALALPALRAIDACTGAAIHVCVCACVRVCMWTCMDVDKWSFFFLLVSSKMLTCLFPPLLSLSSPLPLPLLSLSLSLSSRSPKGPGHCHLCRRQVGGVWFRRQDCETLGLGGQQLYGAIPPAFSQPERTVMGGRCCGARHPPSASPLGRRYPRQATSCMLTCAILE